ncbi:uncharacterized protein RBU33_025052 isoform 2-T5 [Hipposideros larvatus]
MVVTARGEALRGLRRFRLGPGESEMPVGCEAEKVQLNPLRGACAERPGTATRRRRGGTGPARPDGARLSPLLFRPPSAAPLPAMRSGRGGQDSTGGGRGRSGGGLRSGWAGPRPPPSTFRGGSARRAHYALSWGSVPGAPARIPASAGDRSASLRLDRDPRTERRPGEGPQHPDFLTGEDKYLSFLLKKNTLEDIIVEIPAVFSWFCSSVFC